MVDSPMTVTPQPSSTKHQSPTKLESKASLSSLFFASRKSTAFAYGFTFAFVAFTIFLVFDPPWDSSPWFNKVFHASFYSSSWYSYRKENQLGDSPSAFSNENENLPANLVKKMGYRTGNNHSSSPSVYASILSLSQESIHTSLSNRNESSTENWHSSSQSSLEDSGKDGSGLKQSKDGVMGMVRKSSYVSSTSKEGDYRKTSEALSEKGRKQREIELMNNCNIFDGRWVRDNAYPLYAPGSCPHIDESFNCFLNNKPDNVYEKYRWQPKGCNIPRLNGQDMLGLLRDKRLVFVGDSLNRNMWESMVCVLRNSLEDLSRVFEASGRREYRTEGSYSFIFKDYNCSVEFFRSPFLVQEWEMQNMVGSKKETLRLDVIERSFDKCKSADILIFNTGHWWTHEKTAKGKGYYQEGGHVYGELNVKVAYRKALTTWARWVDDNIDPKKTHVFFRGYSPSHFRAGRWNSGGQCDGEIGPILNEAYLGKYPGTMRTLESVIKEMKTPVFYLNITRMTDFRKDAHPSFYRKQNLTEEEKKSPFRLQDCSHWCLPGVPDTWNELVYAQLLIMQRHQRQEQQKRL
ncbi:hypothetical protein FNV43_RR14130 [Rhamnella rubrinervis]|uniref:Trichome birefringence-like N-terminal domain-containing protein n=1 Tax=Rhamnella rubrinervis TaxID=2594499 RepID=A0A8K0H2H1_9ROSA|nr:hypothetical protein FNV43_RR14130 [Rhamnella rubrinervis]